MTTALKPPAAAQVSPAEAYAVETIRDAADLHIERSILHVVNHKTKEPVEEDGPAEAKDSPEAKAPVLSDVELDLAAVKRLAGYLTAQIENVLRDPETAEATFEAGSAVARSCRTILAQPKTFVAESQQIAQALWDATGEDQRIAAGSLIVCRFRAKNHAVPLIALLKIDPTDVLVQTISRQDGKVIVSLRVAENALPTARERLQKAALIAPAGYARQGDLLMLDRLVTKPAADFFALRFLAVRPLPSPRELTETFFRSYLQAKGQLDLTPTQEKHLESKVIDVLQQDSLDVAGWTASLRLPAKSREALRQDLVGALGTAEIAIDPSFAATKLVKMRRLRGDYSILIEFERRAEKRVYEEGEPYQENGATITPVTLKVPNLQPLQ